MRLIIIVVSFLILTIPVLAQGQEPTYDQVNTIARKLNCPTCAGLNLADCRTETCAQWRDQIKDLLIEGKNEQEVLDYFTAQYGDQVLQEPPKKGYTLILWVLPVIALLLGSILLIYIMKIWLRRLPIPQPAGMLGLSDLSIGDYDGEDSDDYLSQVDMDLGDDG